MSKIPKIRNARNPQSIEVLCSNLEFRVNLILYTSIAVIVMHYVNTHGNLCKQYYSLYVYKVTRYENFNFLHIFNVMYIFIYKIKYKCSDAGFLRDLVRTRYIVIYCAIKLDLYNMKQKICGLSRSP